jgi:hypothetical protein
LLTFDQISASSYSSVFFHVNFNPCHNRSMSLLDNFDLHDIVLHMVSETEFLHAKPTSSHHSMLPSSYVLNVSDSDK